MEDYKTLCLLLIAAMAKDYDNNACKHDLHIYLKQANTDEATMTQDELFQYVCKFGHDYGTAWFLKWIYECIQKDIADSDFLEL